MTTQTSNRRASLFVILIFIIGAIGVAVYFAFSGSPPRPDETPVISEANDAKSASRPTEIEAAKEPEKPREAAGLARSEIKTSNPGANEAPLPAAYLKALSGFTGRILEQDGLPVKNARVELLGGLDELMTVNLQTILFENDTFEPRIVQQQTRSDENGKFNFSRVDPRFYYLIGVNLGDGRPYIRFVDHTPSPSTVVDLGDIKLDPPLKVTGRIVSDQGAKPIAGARVNAWTVPSVAFQAGIANIQKDMSLLFMPDRRYGAQIWKMPAWVRNLFDKLPFPGAITGSDGSFTIDGVPAGEVTLVVHAPGRAPTFQRMAATKGPSKDIGDILMNAGEIVEGRVVDEKGAAIANAELMLGIPSPLAAKEFSFLRKAISTDKNGAFHFDGVSGKQVRFVARAEGMTDWTVSDLMDIGDDLVVKIPAPRNVILTIQDDAGKPATLQRAAVSRLLDGPGMFPQFFPALATKTSQVEPGKYKIPGLRSGKYNIYLQSDGFALATAHVEIPAEGNEDTAATVTLERENFINVTVTGMENGKAEPLESAHVGFLKIDRDLEKEGYSSLSTARSDSRGIARVRAMTKGDLLLSATHPGFAPMSIQVKIPDMKDAAIVLLKGGTIRGRVTNGTKPLEKPQFLTIQQRGVKDSLVTLPRFVVTNLDGTYELSHLNPGAWAVEVVPFRMGDRNLASGFTSIFEGMSFFDELPRAEVTVENEKVVECNLDMTGKGREATEADARIHGTVTLNGQPLADARIMVYGGEFKRATTDAGGHYEIGPIRAADWMQINIHESSGGRGFGNQIASKSFKLKAAEDLALDFNIITGGPLRGVVRSAASGELLSNAQVQIIKVVPPRKQEPGEMIFGGDNVSLNRGTDASGAFEFINIPEGTYRVSVHHEGYAPWQSTSLVTISPGGTPAPLDISMASGVTVSGSFTLDTDMKHSWAGLNFQSLDNKGADGVWVNIEDGLSYTSQQLAPGKYRVQLQGNFEKPHPTKAGRTQNVYLMFEPVEVIVPPGGSKSLNFQFKQQKQDGPQPIPVDVEDDEPTDK